LACGRRAIIAVSILTIFADMVGIPLPQSKVMSRCSGALPSCRGSRAGASCARSFAVAPQDSATMLTLGPVAVLDRAAYASILRRAHTHALGSAPYRLSRACSQRPEPAPLRACRRCRTCEPNRRGYRLSRPSHCSSLVQCRGDHLKMRLRQD